MLFYGLHAGRGLATWLAGYGWHWPTPTALVSSIPGVVAGDRLLVGFVSDEAQITTSTSTSGWSSLGSQGQGTTTNHRLTIFTKVATGSDTLTVSVSATTEAGWTVVALVGDGGTPTIVLDNGGSATTATPSAITGLAIDFYDSLVFLGLDNNTAVAHTVTPPSGYANLTTAAATSDPVGAWSMDAAVTGKPAAYQYARTKGGLKVLPEQLTVEEYGMAVRKDLPELTKALNEALAKLKADGAYDKIVAKWFPMK